MNVEPIANAEAVNAAASRPLYAARRKVHPKRIDGVFRRLKWLVMAVALAVYYGTPWLRWDRGVGAPDQAVLLDLPNRKFYFFMIEIWPQEVYYLTGLLILSALLLFLMTSLFGRVWCGYACPQTVWTDLFVHVERWVEGDRNARMRLDQAPWSAAKLGKRLVKHAIWLVIAVATGGAWIFYYADAPTLARQLLDFTAPSIAYFSLGLFAFSTYLLGGIAREQVCTYMCPWPRIQGAMFDEDSLLVGYRADRGEPRGPHRQNESWEDRGDCIDCKLCVAVCPMGIDIREGPQLECIQCALCVDACNTIMPKVGRPGNLIAYDTFRNIERRAQGLPPKFRLLRPRTLVYVGLIVVIGLIMLTGFSLRRDIDLNVLRDRNPIYVRLSDGSLRNGYTVKLLNKAQYARSFKVAVEGVAGARVDFGAGAEGAMIVTPRDAVAQARIFVVLPKNASAALDDGSADIKLVFTDQASGARIVQETSFKGPRK